MGLRMKSGPPYVHPLWPLGEPYLGSSSYKPKLNYMVVVQNTCPQNGHNVGSLFG